jgi:hypothetical protein
VFSIARSLIVLPLRIALQVKCKKLPRNVKTDEDIDVDISWAEVFYRRFRAAKEVASDSSSPNTHLFVPERMHSIVHTHSRCSACAADVPLSHL